MLLGHTLEDIRTYVSIEQSSKFITISFINLCMYHLGRKEIKIGIFLRLPIHVYQCLDPWVIFLKESSELIQPPTSNCTQKEERETWCPNPLPGCAMDRRPLHYRQPLRAPWCSAWHQLSAAFLRASEAKWPPWCSPAPAWSKTCCWPGVRSPREQYQQLREELGGQDKDPYHICQEGREHSPVPSKPRLSGTHLNRA